MTRFVLVPGRWECQRRDTRHTHNLVFRGLGLGRLGHGHHHDLAKGGVHVHAPHSTRPTILGWSIVALILPRSCLLRCPASDTGSFSLSLPCAMWLIALRFNKPGPRCAGTSR